VQQRPALHMLRTGLRCTALPSLCRLFRQPLMTCLVSLSAQPWPEHRITEHSACDGPDCADDKGHRRLPSLRPEAAAHMWAMSTSCVVLWLERRQRSRGAVAHRDTSASSKHRAQANGTNTPNTVSYAGQLVGSTSAAAAAMPSSIARTGADKKWPAGDRFSKACGSRRALAAAVRHSGTPRSVRTHYGLQHAWPHVAQVARPAHTPHSAPSALTRSLLSRARV